MMTQPLILPLEVETGGLPGLKLAWSIYQVPAQTGLHNKALSGKRTNKQIYTLETNYQVQIKVPSNYICVP